MLHQDSLRIVFFVFFGFIGFFGFLEFFLFFLVFSRFFWFFSVGQVFRWFSSSFWFSKLFFSCLILLYWVFMAFCPIKGLPPGKKQDIEQINITLDNI